MSLKTDHTKENILLGEGTVRNIPIKVLHNLFTMSSRSAFNYYFLGLVVSETYLSKL